MSLTIVTYLTHPSVECWNFREHHARRLREACEGCTVLITTTEDEFVQALPQADLAIVWRFKQAWFDHAPTLKRVATPAAGRDYFAVTPPEGVSITYGTFHGPLMAETVLAMMLSECRGIRLALQLQDSDLWPRRAMSDHMRTLAGSNLTVLGFGNIGQWIGKYAKPFGVHVTGVKRTSSSPPDWFDHADRIVTTDALAAVMKTTDHLAICLPSCKATDHIIDAALLEKLPPHAVIYNVGRGNAIDETALFTALDERKIAAAYLDVFSTEPLPEDSPLRTLPNAVLLPHASAIAPVYLDRYLDELIPSIR